MKAQNNRTGQKNRYRLLFKITFVLIFISAICCQFCYTQIEQYAVVYGLIVNDETGIPIPDVNITIEETQVGTTSNQNGEFTLTMVPQGTQTFHFSHINYVPVSYTHYFHPGVPDTIYIRMTSRPIMLDEVEVVDTVSPRFRPGGYYYTREDIEQTAAVTFGQLLQTLVPQANIRESGGNLYIQLQRPSSVGQRFHRGREPYPLIIIDGMRIGTSPIGLAGIADPAHIESFEVVRPPDSQNMYGPEGAFGAIILKTIDRSGSDPLLSSAMRIMLAGTFIGLLLLLFILN